MKKLKLKLQNIEGAEILTREQLKTVMGGSAEGGGPCGDSDVVWSKEGTCSDFSDPLDINGTTYRICKCTSYLCSDGSYVMNNWEVGGCTDVSNMA